ncbi:MAG: VWA domain-containing protein [Gemmatimonadetes bacterium]|nr:VWA domain-containing protein [Gemmatimonadota bacterium]
MPLGFLVPLFLGGIAAVAIPIWVHLTRKQRSLVVPFPSLMFLRQIPFKEDRRRTIQHWLLLALRALVIILLVAAFARPFFGGDAALALSGTGPREVVVLLDRSYSMSAAGRWDEALAAVRRETQGLGPLDRVSLLAFDQGALTVVRSESDPARLRAAADTLQPGWGSTRYGPGLKLAQAILDESDLPTRELVMVSDFQRRGWTGEEGVRLPAGTEVRTVKVTGKGGPNVAVADVALRRDRFSGRERIAPSARLTRTGGDGPAEVAVTLEVDGRELQKRTVTLPAAGAATLEFAPIPLGERHTRGTVRIAADDLPRDDARHFVVSPGSAQRVRAFTRPGAPAEATLFLSRALGISDDGNFDVASAPWTLAGVDGLATGQVVALVDMPFPTGSGGAALRRFVERGGGLLIVTGGSSTWTGDLDAWLGVRIGAPVDRLETGGGRVGWVDYDHPIFQIFKNPRSGDFTSPRFFRYRALTPVEGGTVLARFDDGGPALIEKKVGQGRVLIWASTLDSFWNDLAVQPIFLPFVHQMARYVSGRGETLPWFTSGQVLDVSDVQAMATAGLLEGTEEGQALTGERVVIDPAGTPVRLPGGAGPHYLVLQDAGFYTMRPTGDGESRRLAVAVNVDLAESDPATMEDEEITAALAATVASGDPVGGGGRALELQHADIERRQSIWRLLLAAVLALLAAETVMANRRSTQSATV